MPQVELPQRGDSYALGRKLPAEKHSPFLQCSARPEFESPFAFEEVNMGLVKLAGKIFWSVCSFRNGLSANVLHLVVRQFDDGSNALVGAVLPGVGGRVTVRNLSSKTAALRRTSFSLSSCSLSETIHQHVCFGRFLKYRAR